MSSAPFPSALVKVDVEAMEMGAGAVDVDGKIEVGVTNAEGALQRGQDLMFIADASGPLSNGERHWRIHCGKGSLS